MKGLHNWWHCGPVYIRLYSSTSLFRCKTMIYDMIHDFIRDSDSSISTSSSIMSSSNTTTMYSYTSSSCSSTTMLLQFRVVEVLHSQKMVVIVLWAIYILYICSQTWLVKWLIQIVLQLELICQFSRHYKQCQCQIFLEYTCMYTKFS